jgi:hypothetical protein
MEQPHFVYVFIGVAWSEEQVSASGFELERLKKLTTISNTDDIFAFYNQYNKSVYFGKVVGCPPKANASTYLSLKGFHLCQFRKSLAKILEPMKLWDEDKFGIHLVMETV